VSGTLIRRRVAAGRAIRYLVPRAVEELIVDRRLYRR
jgi:nicotinic acid mononucleotide adenylyltransferase